MTIDIFTKAAQKEFEGWNLLGKPVGVGSPAWFHRRAMIDRLASGRGWRIPPKDLRTNAKGETRGDRKRALRAATNEKIRAEIERSRVDFENWIHIRA